MANQYIRITSWKPLIIVALILSLSCFFIGKWTTKQDVKIPDTKALEARIAELEERQRGFVDVKMQMLETIDNIKNDKRISLITCVINENFAAIQAGKPKDIIFVERDWKIQRMPKYLNMTESDMQWMQQFIK